MSLQIHHLISMHLPPFQATILLAKWSLIKSMQEQRARIMFLDYINEYNRQKTCHGDRICKIPAVILPTAPHEESRNGFENLTQCLPQDFWKKKTYGWIKIIKDLDWWEEWELPNLINHSIYYLFYLPWAPGNK